MQPHSHNFFDNPKTLEAIAEVEHERWSLWQRYLHEQCTPNEDGTLVIPAHLVTRWRRQMETPYSELSNEEKESDREQAVSYIEVLRNLDIAHPG